MNEIQVKPETKKTSKMKKLLSLVMSSKRNKIIAAIIAAIILIAVVALAVTLSLQNRDIPAVVSTSLKKTVEIEQLQTVEFPYCGVATKYSEPKKEGEDPVELYYVAYEGKITAGVEFDFETMVTDVNEDEKKVTITVPPAEIQILDVDEASLKYIFNDKKSEKNEKGSNEAIKLCNEDMKSDTDAINEVLKIAHENAVSAVKALATPIVDSLGDGYTLDVK